MKKKLKIAKKKYQKIATKIWKIIFKNGGKKLEIKIREKFIFKKIREKILEKSAANFYYYFLNFAQLITDLSAENLLKIAEIPAKNFLQIDAEKILAHGIYFLENLSARQLLQIAGKARTNQILHNGILRDGIEKLENLNFDELLEIENARKNAGMNFRDEILRAAAEKIEKVDLKNLRKIPMKFLEISTIVKFLEKIENFSVGILAEFLKNFDGDCFSIAKKIIEKKWKFLKMDDYFKIRKLISENQQQNFDDLFLPRGEKYFVKKNYF